MTRLYIRSHMHAILCAALHLHPCFLKTPDGSELRVPLRPPHSYGELFCLGTHLFEALFSLDERWGQEKSSPLRLLSHPPPGPSVTAAPVQGSGKDLCTPVSQETRNWDSGFHT